MSRYAALFERLAGSGDGAFGAFLMLGDPDLETSARLLDAAVEGGADMIEVGIPFSDPVADGPVIQASAERALARGVRPADAFALLSDFRRRHAQIPVGILTYANLVVARGRDATAAPHGHTFGPHPLTKFEVGTPEQAAMQQASAASLVRCCSRRARSSVKPSGCRR